MLVLVVTMAVNPRCWTSCCFHLSSVMDLADNFNAFRTSEVNPSSFLGACEVVVTTKTRIHCKRVILRHYANGLLPNKKSYIVWRYYGLKGVECSFNKTLLHVDDPTFWHSSLVSSLGVIIMRIGKKQIPLLVIDQRHRDSMWRSINMDKYSPIIYNLIYHFLWSFI